MPSSTMDKYCGSTFWNSSLSWYTDDPDLTRCFEKTVLVWIPCIFLWVFSSLNVYYVVSSKDKNIPWNFFNISKLLVNSVLIIVSLTDLATAVGYPYAESYEIYNVDIYDPIIKLLSFMLTLLFVLYNRKYGIRTSGMLFIFWLLAVVCGGAQFRTEILEARKQPAESYYFHISYWIYYFLVCVMLLLNCFVDEAPKITKYPTSQNPCMEESASFLNRIAFGWFDSLAWKGYKNPLEAPDLCDLKHEDMAKEIFPNFDKYWQQSLKKAERPPAQHHRASFKSDDAQVDFVSCKQKKQVSILPALCKTFGPAFLFGAFLKLFENILSYSTPLILELLITYVEEKESQWKGFLYIAALFVSTTIQTLVLSQYFYLMSMVGMHMRTALTSAIYRKALHLSNSAKKESSTGELINLMAVDAQIFADVLPYINMICSAPVEIILALYFLWNLLGPSVLAGVAVMIVLIPFSTVITNRLQRLQVKEMKNKDDRVQLMSEVLGGIKVLKLHAWEPSFEKQILKIRGKEVGILKKCAYLYAGMAGVSSLGRYLVPLFTFVTFVNISDENVLTPQRAFVSLTFFSKMHFAMRVFPLIVWAIESYVSVKRLTKFLNSEELDPDNVQHYQSQNEPVLIKNGNFSWGEDLILKNINITFEKGTLTAVVGSVGSGKSSLISALLGEMDRISGSVNTLGSIAYVSQQAWIQNATLQDNITFGRNMSNRVYNKIIEACALKQDFGMLPVGDQTEIGEKGINVSGGQKQRISLARAVYSDADIYLLDDPLSAVDSHVGKHIFEHVIGPEGLLKDTTRVLVTHGVTFLPEVDKIIVLKDGEVSEIGTYQDLLKNKGAFSDFITQYLDGADDKGNNEEDELKNQLGSASVSEGQKKEHSVVSQSPSDVGSEKANCSLKRRKSNLALKQRSGSVDSSPEEKDVGGDKLIEEEGMETGSVKWSVFMHYFRSMGMTLTITTLVLNVLSQVFVVGSNIWLSVWASDKNATSQQRDLYLGVYGALGFGQISSVFLSTVALYVCCLNGAYVLHNSLLHNILRAPCNTFFDVTPVGRILNRFSEDVDTLDNTLPLVVRGWLNCFFSVLSIFFIISYTTPVFMVLILPIGVVYYIVQKFYIATSRQLKRLEAVSRSPVYSHFGESVSGASTIRAYGQTERFIKESEAKVDFNQVCNYPSIVAERWLAVRLEMVGNLLILFAALFAVLNREQDAGLVGLSLSFAFQVTENFNQLVINSSDVETNVVSVERIKKYEETSQEAPWEITGKAPPQNWPATGTIEFNNYALCYRPGLDLVLKGINFLINAGERIGIVGRTGSGKSTLAVSLFRIVEAAQGEILIDGINILEIGLHALRSHLTIIPQDAVLFSGSLRMNLDPNEKHSDEDIWRCLDLAQLKDFVKELPAGLNHEVTEGGENLSVGQRQLVCLSRALLRKSKVLILDEATAAIDLATDDVVQKMLQTEFKECTVLTIAHRLNTVMDSDRILVLDKGYIVDFDAPNNLLQDKKSVFYGMAKDAGLV